jgi:hypothetical protein
VGAVAAGELGMVGLVLPAQMAERPPSAAMTAPVM